MRYLENTLQFRKTLSTPSPGVVLRESYPPSGSTASLEALGDPVSPPHDEIDGLSLPPFPGLVRRPTASERVAVISDLHVPFHSPRRVDAVLSVIESDPPDLIVILGDVWDCYPLSRWDTSPDRHKTIQEEIASGRPIIERIDSIAPVVFLMGNHDERFDKLIARNPELMGAIDFRTVFGIPDGWDVLPPRTLYRLGDLTYLHGDLPGMRGGVGCERRMMQELHCSCVFGHTHRTGSHFDRGSDDRLLASYAVGHLASPEVSREYRPVNGWVSSFATVTYDRGRHSLKLHPVGEDGAIPSKRYLY